MSTHRFRYPTVTGLAVRVVFTLVTLPLASYAWQPGASSTPPCLAAGQISGWDVLERSLSLKSDSGHYSDVSYDDSTVFTDGETTVSPVDLNVDDRLCIQAFLDHSESVASRVLVTRRSEIDVRDRHDLLEWERDSVFGTVKLVDINNRRIALQTPAGSQVVIDAGGPIAFWTLPAQAIDPADAVPGHWQELKAGDEIYVRGDGASTTGAIRARLIVSGGFRSFIGAIESMDPLTEVLRLRDFRSGRSCSVHFDFTQIYIVGKNSGLEDRRLYSATVGDLKEGDSVLVLARQHGEAGRVDGLLLITGFSRDGILQPAPGESSDWIFKAVGFGGQPSTQP